MDIVKTTPSHLLSRAVRSLKKKKYDYVFLFYGTLFFCHGGHKRNLQKPKWHITFFVGWVPRGCWLSSLLLSLSLYLSLPYRPAVAGSCLQLVVIGYLIKTQNHPPYLDISSHLYPFLCISTFNLPYTDLFRQNFLTRILPARLEKDRYHFSVFVASLEAALLSLRLGTHGVFDFFFLPCITAISLHFSIIVLHR